MKLLAHPEIDCAKWDALVAQSEKSPCDYSWYLNTVANTWYLYVDENYTKGTVVCTSKNIGIEHVVVPPTVKAHQCYGNWSVENFEQFKLILQKHFSAGVYQNTAAIGDTIRQGQVVRKLSLSSHAARNIKKALKNNIEIRSGIHIQPVFELICENLASKIENFQEKQQQILLASLHKLQEKQQLIILEMYSEGKLIGGLFFFNGKNVDIYLKGTANETGKKFGAMYFAMEKQISQTLTAGKIFDFDGSEVPGVKRFNDYFGTEESIYTQLNWDNSPFWFKSLRKLYALIKK